MRAYAYLMMIVLRDQELRRVIKGGRRQIGKGVEHLPLGKPCGEGIEVCSYMHSSSRHLH